MQEEQLVQQTLVREAGLDRHGRPVLVFYACYLPKTNSVDYDRLLECILHRLDRFVENEYVVVLFASGGKYQPSWSWLFKAYQSLSRTYRKNLKHLYIVHPSSWFRILFQVMGRFLSPKFAKKVEWMSTLTDLSAQVPMGLIEIPQPVLEVDRSLGSSYSPVLVAPKQFGTSIEALMGSKGEKGLPRVVKDCTRYIRANGLKSEGIFRRSPNAQQLRLIREEYDRNSPQIDLSSHGGTQLAAVLLKTFFKELPNPVFDASKYEVIQAIQGFSDSNAQVEYAKVTLLPLLQRPMYLLVRHVFKLLAEVYEYREVNLMTSHNLAIVWAPNMVRSSDPVRDFNMCVVGGVGEGDGGASGGVGTFVKLCIENWDRVFPEGEDCQDGTN
ncbi:divergent CRAL/TRIO domain-containing protein [Zopfochytrium polystomum]|nr:divergent CRAL/TRIO domain-containing protein [Zopfochytrium polystomum]